MPGALIGVFDVRTGMIDQMHIMHAGRTGCHAGKTRQAAVDMFDRFLVRRLIILQHVFHQIDAATRGIELVAQDRIGRASGGTKAAMYAGAQDLFRMRDMRIGQLFGGEIGLHITL